MSGLIKIAGQNRLMTVALAMLVLLGSVIAWNLRQPQPDARIEAIRAQGHPVTLSELDAWYLSVPPAENVALICRQAFAEPGFTNSASGLPSSKAWLSPRGQNLCAADQEKLATLLATTETSLRLFHSLPPAGRSRYPIDMKLGAMTLLPDLARIKEAAMLLGAEAMIHSAHHEHHEVIQSLIAAGRVADSVADEPILISQLVRIACWDIIATRLELVLCVNEPGDADLAALQQAVAIAERPGAIARAFIAERAFGAAVFTDADQQIGLITGFNRPTSRKDLISRDLSVTLLKATGMFQKDRAFFLDAMATNIAAAQCPFPERIQRGQAAASFSLLAPNRFCLISRMMLPAQGKIFVRDADHAARIRVLLAVLAIERFRRAHGESLPQSLQELVPAYLSTVPADPYDGKPLRFKPLQTGYAIYSIGSDLHDDGGVAANATNSMTSLKMPQDIGVVVERSLQRETKR